MRKLPQQTYRYNADKASNAFIARVVVTLYEDLEARSHQYFRYVRRVMGRQSRKPGRQRAGCMPSIDAGIILAIYTRMIV